MLSAPTTWGTHLKPTTTHNFLLQPFLFLPFFSSQGTHFLIVKTFFSTLPKRPDHLVVPRVMLPQSSLFASGACNILSHRVLLDRHCWHSFMQMTLFVRLESLCVLTLQFRRRLGLTACTAFDILQYSSSSQYCARIIWTYFSPTGLRILTQRALRTGDNCDGEYNIQTCLLTTNMSPTTSNAIPRSHKTPLNCYQWTP